MLASAAGGSTAESDMTTLSEGITRALNHTTLAERGFVVPELTGETSSQLLKRMLSTKSIISTTSSFASRMQRAAPRSAPGTEDFRIIGLGSCGSVFEIPGTEMAIKKGSSAESLWTDFCLTNRVHNAIRDVRNLMQQKFPEHVIPKTPLCHEFHLPDDNAYWADGGKLERFPASHRSKQPLFHVDRIAPVPKPARDALIDMYFAEDTAQAAKKDPDNADCLIRIYLGERESPRQQTETYDTLRNFPLRLNMLEDDLRLEPSDLAAGMAIGLAILHWQAQVDGMDVEFVLGSTSENWEMVGYDDLGAPPHTVTTMSLQRREAVRMWMFDFDKASAVEELTQEAVVKRFVPAFLGNDPYYPLPRAEDGDGDKGLWERFCAAYLKASKVILGAKKGVGNEIWGLPRVFLDEVVRVVRENEAWDKRESIVFAK
ncbi:MAG: hypothetical protein L6R39_001941 [Caloplaca ligustica]|nr:MAG: hypothetical protein L6R39_001941 [Caloplaca ligustica]